MHSITVGYILLEQNNTSFTVPGVWLLLTSFWDDNGFWDDSKTWID